MGTQIEGVKPQKSIKNQPLTLEGPSGVPWGAQGHQNGAREWQNDSQGPQNEGKKNATNRTNKKKHLKQHGGGVWRQQMDIYIYIYDTSSRPQTRFLFVTMKEEWWRRNHRKGIIGEESWMRTHGGVIMEEESWRWNC